MALIKCYECGKEISDKAPSCPHCGAPKLVAANKKVKTKKSLVFSKYLKPIGIGLGVIVLPLAAVASVPLIQADGNVDAVVWRFKNKKFIKERCYWNDIEKKTPQSKKCRALLYKLGEKAEKVALKSHKRCINDRHYNTNINDYESCIKRWDRIHKERAKNERDYQLRIQNESRPLDQTTHKGKTYTASRKCPVGQNMYWSVTSGFMRKTKVSELGCMTKAQNEEYWRQYKLQQAGAPRGTGGGSGWNYNNQAQQNRMRIQTNEYKRYLDNYSKEMGW